MQSGCQRVLEVVLINALESSGMLCKYRIFLGTFFAHCPKFPSLMQVAVFVNPKPGFRLVLPLKVFSPSLKRTPWQTDDEVHDVFLVPF